MADFELWVKGRRVERFASDADPEDADECAALLRSTVKGGKHKLSDSELRGWTKRGRKKTYRVS